MTYDIAIESLASRIPPHWETFPFRRLATLVDAANADRSAPLLSLASTGVIAPREEFEGLGRQMPANETIGRYWLAEPGDLVVNPMWLVGGGIGISEASGAVSPDYRVYRLGPGLCPRYVHHLLRSQPYRDQYKLYTRAETTFDRRVSKVDFHAMPILVPPVDEQRRIADFLDEETARIEHIIAIRQKQSALGARRFRLLVDGVVTGDIDSLTEIGYCKGSADWNVGKIARLFAVIPGYAFESAGFIEPDAGTRLLRGINVTPGRIDWEAETVAWNLESSPIDKRFYLRRDDLVVGMDRPWVGGGTRVALIHETDLPSLLLQRVACIRSRSTSTTRYLRWVLGSSHFQVALEGETTGVSVPHISGDQIGAFMYRLPSPDDQVLLAKLLQSHDDLRAAQANLVDRQLALLAERRQALITAAVTGQIDVTTARGVAV